jgi:hypothetical protein
MFTSFETVAVITIVGALVFCALIIAIVFDSKTINQKKKRKYQEPKRPGLHN